MESASNFIAAVPRHSSGRLFLSGFRFFCYLQLLTLFSDLLSIFLEDMLLETLFDIPDVLPDVLPDVDGSPYLEVAEFCDLEVVEF